MKKLDMQSVKTNFGNFKKSPAFSGFILFMIGLVTYLVVQWLYSPSTFFTYSTLNNLFVICKNYTPLILLTMAQALLMFLGIIDISIGIQMSFANVLAANLPTLLGIPTYWGWILAVISTIVLATCNGVIVSKLRIPPLLAGYAMIYIVKGINLWISPTSGGSVPMAINTFYTTKIFNFIPVSALIIALCMGGWMILKKTSLAKQVFAVGGNERNAYITGIDGTKVKIKMYVLAGVLTGIAGLCYTAAYTTGNPITGESYGLQSISACILGGIALAGGIGTMSCALYGIGFQVLIQSCVPKIFSLVSRITGETYNTYWHNMLTDTIILVTLVITVVLISKSSEEFKKGVKKQIFGGDKK